MKPSHLIMPGRQSLIASAATAALIVPSSLPRALVSGYGIKADAADPKALFEALNKTVTELRAEHDAATKPGGKIDGLVNAKFDAMNDTITNLEAALQTIQNAVTAGITPVNGVIGDIPANPEYIKNFKQHMRTGVGDQVGSPVHNAMSIGTAADGGYLAPVEWDRSITDQLVQSSPIRANSEVITISGQGFSRLFAIGQPGSGWVGETAARPATSTPQFAPLTFGVGEIYANPAITQTALDDAAINLESWLGNSVQGEFSRQENIAFLSGDGTNKPRGILTYVTGAANAALHPLGAILVSTAADDVTLTGDDFLKILYDTPAERLTGISKWYMNRATQAKIRTLKTTDGQYIWAPGLVATQPSSLLGYSIIDVPAMPNVAASAIVALFGDMKATYLVIDRVGIRVLRDPYTNKPYVMFYTTKRVGGGVQNPEYMRALKMAAA